MKNNKSIALKVNFVPEADIAFDQLQHIEKLFMTN